MGSLESRHLASVPATGDVERKYFVSSPPKPGWSDSIDSPNFYGQGQCHGEDVELFYSEGKSGVNKALKICLGLGGCAVQDKCLAYELKKSDQWGVWGGLTKEQRRTIKRVTKDGASEDEIGTLIAQMRSMNLRLIEK